MNMSVCWCGSLFIVRADVKRSLFPKAQGALCYVGRRPRRCLSIDLRGGQWHMSCAAVPRPALVKAGAMYHARNEHL
ncbi:unnamed protein product [Leptosia nina]|uniref:Uncharacterized protein n=1 Tax=Leptosia nina TaxID=320188 RepID=A0AAV1JHL6_9NEOP